MNAYNHVQIKENREGYFRGVAPPQYLKFVRAYQYFNNISVEFNNDF